MVDTVTAYAPATVANLGPGFDVLGLALERPGDKVTATLTGRQGIVIEEILGDGGLLSLDPEKNTAGVAARETLRQAGVEVGLSLRIEKGMGIGTGLGSSAASAAAAAYAVNALIGSPLRKSELIGPCVQAEALVSGPHADNVAPALLGGLILVRSCAPVDVVRLPVPEGLSMAVVTPDFELETRKARSVLPEQVPLKDAIQNGAHLACFVSACHSGDISLIGRSIRDVLVTPARAPLIPGCEAVIDAAMSTGALGASISGAGPSIFAICRSSQSAAECGASMAAEFARVGLDATVLNSAMNCPGARCP
jgi:homoserine kinase